MSGENFVCPRCHAVFKDAVRFCYHAAERHGKMEDYECSKCRVSKKRSHRGELYRVDRHSCYDPKKSAKEQDFTCRQLRRQDPLLRDQLKKLGVIKSVLDLQFDSSADEDELKEAKAAEAAAAAVAAARKKRRHSATSRKPVRKHRRVEADDDSDDSTTSKACGGLGRKPIKMEMPIPADAIVHDIDSNDDEEVVIDDDDAKSGEASEKEGDGNGGLAEDAEESLVKVIPHDLSLSEIETDQILHDVAQGKGEKSERTPPSSPPKAGPSGSRKVLATPPRGSMIGSPRRPPRSGEKKLSRLAAIPTLADEGGSAETPEKMFLTSLSLGESFGGGTESPAVRLRNFMNDMGMRLRQEAQIVLQPTSAAPSTAAVGTS